MKLFKILSIMFVFAMMVSCVDRAVIKTAPERPGDNLFARAEKSFNSGRYDMALKYYSEYLVKYPKQPLAPAALLKKGAVFSAQKRYVMARSTYDEMISTYPNSPYVSDGMVEILVTYYKEGRYQAVIEKSYSIPENLKPSDYVIRKYAIVGDAFLAMDAPVLAVDSFITAYKIADTSENRGVLLKLRKALGRLADEDVIRVLDGIEEKDIRGYFVYQRCLNALRQSNTDDALRMVTGFLKLFPKHALVHEAEALKAKLINTDFDLFTVGCLLPTSGQFASYGLKAQKGFDLAYNDFSTDQENPTVRILYRDTNSDPEITKAAVRELAELGAAVIVGPIGTVEVAAEEAQLRGVPIITLTGKEDVTSIGDYVFRNFLTRKMQVKSVVSYAFEVLGLNNFAVLYPDEKYGQDFMNMFWDEVNIYNGDVVGVESYKPGSTDFAKPIRKLIGMHYKQAKEPLEEGGNTEDGFASKGEDEKRLSPVVDFDAIFIPDSSSEIGLILPQLAFYDVGDVYLIGTNLWHTEELISRAGKNASHAIIPDGFFAGSSEPEVQQFVRNYREIFEETPGFIEAISYDSANIVFDIIKRGNIENTGAFRDELFEVTDYKGVTGSTSFDDRGDTWKQLYLMKVQGRRFIECPK